MVVETEYLLSTKVTESIEQIEKGELSSYYKYEIQLALNELEFIAHRRNDSIGD